MAVLPWIGQIAEPDHHNEPNPAKPDVTYDLEYVYGYRSADTRQNVKFNCNGEVVYMTAAVGVILDTGSNTQKFFGGKCAETSHKSKANDMDQHTDDILALAISNDRKTVVTGQVGQAPVLFTWDACTGEKKQRFKMAKGGRGVNAVAFSEDGSLIGCVDLHNEHNVYVFNAESGAMVMKSAGDTNKIFDIAFSNQPGSKDFCTAGKKHFYMWNAESGASSKKKGLFGSFEMTSFSCCIWDDQGRAFAGGSNSSVYVFQERNCIAKIDCHKGGFISGLSFFDNCIWSGGKDGQVMKIETGDLSFSNSHSFDSPVRAIDSHNGSFVMGLRNGCIMQDG